MVSFKPHIILTFKTKVWLKRNIYLFFKQWILFLISWINTRLCLKVLREILTRAPASNFDLMTDRSCVFIFRPLAVSVVGFSIGAILPPRWRDTISGDI